MIKIMPHIHAVIDHKPFVMIQLTGPTWKQFLSTVDMSIAPDWIIIGDVLEQTKMVDTHGKPVTRHWIAIATNDPDWFVTWDATRSPREN